VLDVCAAPGGKATHAACIAGSSGLVVAADVSLSRLELVGANAGRLGVPMLMLAQDGRRPAVREGFDRVLVDAPCSGLGVLNSRPDLRWRARPLPELQLDLLRAAVERTKPGGSVTYSVCTINRAENEDVVDALGLPLDDLGAEFPDFRHPRRPEFLLTLPHVHRTSGFFVARLRRP
jgi:16S rRNA (cytosine967-C5)-methyltransferase